MSARALDGLVVLERAGRLAAAAGATMLGELGATVVRAEDPSLPAPHEPASWRRHPLALAGKRRVRLSNDPAEAAGQWRALEARADVVICSPPLPDGPAAPDGPIRCDVSAFGREGADGLPDAGLPGTDLPGAGLPDDAGEAILQALGGMMSTTGRAGGPPEFIAAPLIEMFAGLNVVTTVLAALRVRERGEAARRVDLSLFDSSVALVGAFVGHAVTGKGHGMRGGSRHPLCCPWNAYPTRDGWALMCSSTEPHWRRILTLIGRDDLQDDPRFATMAARIAHRDTVDALIAGWTRGRTTKAAVTGFQGATLPAGEIVTLRELLEGPDRPPTRRVATPDGEVTVPASLFAPSGSPGVARDRVAGDRIEDPAATPDDAAAGLAPLTRHLAAAPSSGRLPLAGVRVVEVGVFTAGPLGGRYLADLGAEVIKVEQPGGENGRAWQPNFGGVSGYFATYNAGKRSIAIDLRSEDGKAALDKLIASADVLLQNLKAGAMDAMGFGPAAMRARYPKLIYCSVSGYGSTGSTAPALDTVIQAQSGLMSLIESRDEPVKAGLSVADLLAAHISPPAIIAALRHREATGEGQHIDISMRDALAWTTQLSWPGGGTALAGACRLDCADGWLVAECPAAAWDALGGTKPEGIARGAALAALAGAGIAAAPVLELDDIVTHKLSRKRALFREAATEGGTPAPVLASPFRFDGKPLDPGASVPAAGEYNAVMGDDRGSK